MIVFSNTTPFIALSSINQLNLLPQLFGTIHVVYEVVEECRAGSFITVPDLESLPWVQLVESQLDINYKTVLLELDKGEKHTLNMALKLKADKVIIDEKIGRNIAEYLGLSVVGTLGILIAAKQRGWINSFSNLVKDMRSQGIYYHPGLVKKLSQTIGE